MAGTAVLTPGIDPALDEAPSMTATHGDGAAPVGDGMIALPIFDDDGILIDVVMVEVDEAP